VVVIYSDLNSFTASSVPLLYNLDAVYQSLTNLFSTHTGERVFLPEFGFDLEEELFEIIDDVTTVEILRRVVNAVERWEQRVTVDSSRTKIIPDSDNNAYHLTLAFNVIGLEDTSFEYKVSFVK